MYLIYYTKEILNILLSRKVFCINFKYLKSSLCLMFIMIYNEDSNKMLNDIPENVTGQTERNNINVVNKFKIGNIRPKKNKK